MCLENNSIWSNLFVYITIHKVPMYVKFIVKLVMKWRKRYFERQIMTQIVTVTGGSYSVLHMFGTVICEGIIHHVETHTCVMVSVCSSGNVIYHRRCNQLQSVFFRLITFRMSS